MGELEPSNQKHLSQVPQAQLVAESPDQDLEHDVGRELQKVKYRTGPLVEGPMAAAAFVAQVPEQRGFRQCGGLGELAIRANHWQRPPYQRSMAGNES